MVPGRAAALGMRVMIGIIIIINVEAIIKMSIDTQREGE